MNEYDDIIDLPHFVSKKHRQMPMENRAAQFAPFAALDGHEETLSETARLTSDKIFLSRYEKDRLSDRLLYAIESRQPVNITFFRHDKLKAGGSYAVLTGVIRKVDDVSRAIILQDKSRIPLDDIHSLSGTIFNGFDDFT